MLPGSRAAEPPGRLRSAVVGCRGPHRLFFPEAPQLKQETTRATIFESHPVLADDEGGARAEYRISRQRLVGFGELLFRRDSVSVSKDREDSGPGLVSIDHRCASTLAEAAADSNDNLSIKWQKASRMRIVIA